MPNNPRTVMRNAIGGQCGCENCKMPKIQVTKDKKDSKIKVNKRRWGI